MALADALTLRLRRADWETWLGQVGMIARGLLYALVGYLAAAVALRHDKGQADNKGALQLLARQPLGRLFLLAIAIGFCAYAGWRVVEAVQADKWLKRAGYVGKALIYVALTASAGKLAFGHGDGGKQREVDLTAKALHLPGGRVLVVVAGLGVVAIACANFWRIFSGKYEEALPNRRSKKSRQARSILQPVAVVGLVGRGVAFVLVGVFIVAAALHRNAGEAGGLDAALRRLRAHAFGPPILLVIAAGLFAYALFCFMQSRWEVSQTVS
ncbi:MAG TPA: DUF1206 domain-containing protein [Acidimicrobiales bacterium]|nr:DUF1206 domain-containing protein [Acidimicrobiales bacterium]